MVSASLALLSPGENLRQFVCSDLIAIVQLLERVSINNVENQFDSALLKLDQIIQIGICSEEQGLWHQMLPQGLPGTLIDLLNTLMKIPFAPGPEIMSNKPLTVQDGSRPGRPAFDIPRETLKLYLNYRFTSAMIAEMLGVSAKSVSQKLKAKFQNIPTSLRILTKLFRKFIKIFPIVK